MEQWIKSSDEASYEHIVPILRSCIENLRPNIEKMSVMQPFSFVLIDEDHETLQDLVISDSEETVMLDSTLESEEALKGYAVHPEHVAVANGKVRPYTVQRSCLDFEI